MNVRELIEKLKEYPEDMQVILEDGGEGGGYNHARHLDIVKVSSYSGGRGRYYGELTEYEKEKKNMTYRKAGSDQDHRMFTSHFKAVVISC